MESILSNKEQNQDDSIQQGHLESGVSYNHENGIVIVYIYDG